MDADDEGKRHRALPAPRSVFPELITEEAETVEKQVYGAVADYGVEGLVNALLQKFVVAASNRHERILHCR